MPLGQIDLTYSTAAGPTSDGTQLPCQGACN